MSDAGYHERRPVTQQIVSASSVHKARTTDVPYDILEFLKSEPGCDSDSDSDVDSDYASLEDPNDTADFYDDLLDRFRTDVPTLATHGDWPEPSTQSRSGLLRRFPHSSQLIHEYGPAKHHTDEVPPNYNHAASDGEEQQA